MRLKFKNRIALLYLAATALAFALVFVIVFSIVRSSVYTNVDRDLLIEAVKHTTEVDLEFDELKFNRKGEWEEREHREIEVNPVFIQLLDIHGKAVDRSPNLKENVLTHSIQVADYAHYTAHLQNRHLRQVRVPILFDGNTKGYILAAMSLESSIAVLDKLLVVLCVSYPIVLFGLFFVSRFLAGRSILPVIEIRDSADRITRDSLNERVPVSDTKDELQDLSVSINKLLQRIEDAVERERQFTSNASHELRTPLAVLRGTLEVLIRKPRTQDEYEQKVKQSLAEIDRLTLIMEQLLVLSRLDQASSATIQETASLFNVAEGVISTLSRISQQKGVKIQLKNNLKYQVEVFKQPVALILTNLIGNAIKYSGGSAIVLVEMSEQNGSPVCAVTDLGVGIAEGDLQHIFEPFYRSAPMDHPNISGNGLGLAIAQKTAKSLGAEIQVRSKLGEGSTFSLILSQS